jgi:hypothetical protein
MVAEGEEVVPAKYALELLPAEVWWHVLQQLEFGPLADVVRLAQVCRTFCALALGSETALGEANTGAVASTAPPPFAPLRTAAIAHQWRLLSRQRWQQPVRNVGPLGPSPLIQISTGIIGAPLQYLISSFYSYLFISIMELLPFLIYFIVSLQARRCWRRTWSRWRSSTTCWFPRPQRHREPVA